MDKKIYTIGHSNYDIDLFLKMLKNNNINCLIDVRSIPYSKYCNNYNKELLSKILKDNSIIYIHMGKELGAKRNCLEEYTDGMVDFEKVKRNNDFLEGIKRLENGINKGYNISLMCSEKEPCDCHRSILIGKYMHDKKYKVFHIKEDCVITQEDVEKLIIEEFFLERKQISFLDILDMSKDNRVEAYTLKNKQIAHKINNKFENQI